MADVAAPDGSGQRVPVPQTGPGRYEGAFPAPQPGVYFVQITQTEPDTGRLVARHTTGYALPHLPEYAVNPTNRVLLERLAAATGAPALTWPESAWDKGARRAARPQPVWPELLAGALVLFVADVAVRRLRPTGRDLAPLRALAGRAGGLTHRLNPAAVFRNGRGGRRAGPPRTRPGPLPGRVQ